MIAFNKYYNHFNLLSSILIVVSLLLLISSEITESWPQVISLESLLFSYGDNSLLGYNKHLPHPIKLRLDCHLQASSRVRTITKSGWLDTLASEELKRDLVTIEPPSKEVIAFALEQVEDRKFLLNTSGKSYREIGASAIKALSEDEVLELLSSDSKLLKRPFVISQGGTIVVGFNPSNWEKVLLNCN